jgi:hypothetical protein
MNNSNDERHSTREGRKQNEPLAHDEQNLDQASSSQSSVTRHEGEMANHEHLIEIYGPIVVAALEGLRSAVYPHSRLEDFSKSHKPYQREAGWAIGVDSRTDDLSVDETGTPKFEAYVHVSLIFNEEGKPAYYECRGRHGYKTKTSRGDLTQEGLVEALKRLLAKEDEGQVWRWLGHQE